jgi:prolycopene isomerase
LSVNVRKESRFEDYDVVVIGSGIGGLSAASLLSLAGKKVLVVERHDRPGGYAHSFRRGYSNFDAAVHFVGGCSDGGLVDELLRVLSVREKCEFVKVSTFYQAIFPDLSFDVPAGREEFIERYSSIFPSKRKEVENLVGICRKISDESKTFPLEPSILDLARTIRKSPTLAKYSKATLEQVMSKYTDDSKLKSAFATLWPYVGLPPSRLSFLYWSSMLMSFLEEGVYYCKGTFQNYANALVSALERTGGEIMLHTRAEKIIVRQGSVKGVKLENGEEIRATTVISNVDATQTFEDMVGMDKMPGSYLRKLRKMRPALSAFVVYLSTDLDLKALGANHEMFIYNTWDHEKTYEYMQKGDVSSPDSSVAVTVPTLADPSLARKGEHIMTIMTLVPYDVGASWRDEKSRYAEELVQKAESKFPGLKSHTLMMEGATPRTMERYTLNLTGSIYGWEVSPQQMGLGRLHHRTPIKGLYLSGHWTQPGGGIYAVTVSGIQTAQMILGFRSHERLFEELGGKAPKTDRLASSAIPDAADLSC